jgi:hypothetical protein
LIILTSTAVLNKAYRNEKDADVWEKILLVDLFIRDKKEESNEAVKEFHKFRRRAYKWLGN